MNTETLGTNQFLRKIWTIENRNPTASKRTGCMVGDGCLEVVVVNGRGIRTEFAGETVEWSDGLYLGGHIDRPSYLELLPETKLTAVKLQPWAAGLLAGLDFRESMNATIPLQEISPQLTRLMEAGRDVRTGDHDLNLISAFMELQLSKWSDSRLIQKASWHFESGFDDFRSAKGSLLRELGVSPRTLEMKFGRAVGLTPQKFANTVRFRQVSEHLLHRGNAESLATVGLRFGYYDQAHFIRSCKATTGLSPSQLTPPACFVTNSDEPFRSYTI